MSRITYTEKNPLMDIVSIYSATDHQKLLTESEESGDYLTKPLYIDILLQKADTENGNGRTYPYKILYNACEKYKKEFVPRRSYGQLDHPEHTSVELKEASHRIVDMWWKDKEVYGKLKILRTPYGKIVREILADGGDIAISSRGVGSVEELGNGLYEVQDDFELVCWDIVANPSTRGAWGKVSSVTDGIKESKNLAKTNPKQACINKIDCLIHEIISDFT